MELIEMMARQEADKKRLANLFKVPAKPRKKAITKADVDAAVRAALLDVEREISVKARFETQPMFKSGLYSALDIVRAQLFSKSE